MGITLVSMIVTGSIPAYPWIYQGQPNLKRKVNQFHINAMCYPIVDYCLITTTQEHGTSSDSTLYCEFPFFYKGKKYTNCTSVDYTRDWCFIEIWHIYGQKFNVACIACV